MGIISVENLDRLYWLGRYSERVYTSARLFATSFDRMIDMDLNDHARFCELLDIPDIYRSREDFCERYILDEQDRNSIYANLIRAYDNAVELRNEIGSEPITYMQLSLYDMKRSKVLSAPIVGLQKVIDNILAFWGIVDDMIEDENVRNIIKTGKRIERLDLYGRLQADRTAIAREVHRLAGRIRRTNLHYDAAKIEELMELVETDEIDYDRIVELADSVRMD